MFVLVIIRHSLSKFRWSNIHILSGSRARNTCGVMNNILNDKLSLEDQVRADRAKGLTYREIAKKRRLNFTQIKEILNSEDQYVINKKNKLKY